MTYELGRALLLTETVDAAALGDALLVASRQHLPLVHALARATGAASSASAVQAELANATADVEANPIASADLLGRLPAELCARLGVVPLRIEEGVVIAGAADVRDRHAAEELAYWLQAEVQLIRAPLTAIERALVPGAARAMQATEAADPSAVAPMPSAPLKDSSAASQVPVTLATPGVAPPPPSAPSAPSAPSSPPDAPVPHAPHLSSRPPQPATRSETPPWGTPVRRSVRPPAPNLTLSHPPSFSVRSVPAAPPPLPHVSGSRPPSHAPPRPSERPIKSDLPPSASMSVAAIVPLHSTPPDPYVAAAVPRFSSRPPQTPPMPTLASPLPMAAKTTRDFSGALTSGPPRPEDALEAVSNATDRDELVATLLSAGRAVATRVAIFAVRRDVFAGWTCTTELADPAAFRELTVPLGAPSVLALATVAGSYFGPIVRNDAHAPLLALMGAASRDVAVVAVRASGRAALILLADDLHDTMLGTRHLEKLAGIAGAALSKLVRVGGGG